MQDLHASALVGGLEPKRVESTRGASSGSSARFKRARRVFSARRRVMPRRAGVKAPCPPLIVALLGFEATNAPASTTPLR